MERESVILHFFSVLSRRKNFPGKNEQAVHRGTTDRLLFGMPFPSGEGSGILSYQKNSVPGKPVKASPIRIRA